MRQIFLLVSFVITATGLYLKFLYDVPDVQETINFFVSGALIILGVSSFFINLFWDTPKGRSGRRDRQ
jgi:hypothetical protein